MAGFSVETPAWENEEIEVDSGPSLEHLKTAPTTPPGQASDQENEFPALEMSSASGYVGPSRYEWRAAIGLSEFHVYIFSILTQLFNQLWNICAYFNCCIN